MVGSWRLSLHLHGHRSEGNSVSDECVPQRVTITPLMKPEQSNKLVSDPRLSSRHWGSSRKLQSSSTAESCSSLKLSSSFLRWEGLDFRADVSDTQLTWDSLQQLNLISGRSRSKPKVIILDNSPVYSSVSILHVSTSNWTFRCRLVHRPKSLQATLWDLQITTEQLHSGVLQIVFTQLQLPQVRRVGLQS